MIGLTGIRTGLAYLSGLDAMVEQCKLEGVALVRARQLAAWGKPLGRDLMKLLERKLKEDVDYIQQYGGARIGTKLDDVAELRQLLGRPMTPDERTDLLAKSDAATRARWASSIAEAHAVVMPIVKARDVSKGLEAVQALPGADPIGHIREDGIPMPARTLRKLAELEGARGTVHEFRAQQLNTATSTRTLPRDARSVDWDIVENGPERAVLLLGTHHTLGITREQLADAVRAAFLSALGDSVKGLASVLFLGNPFSADKGAAALLRIDGLLALAAKHSVALELASRDDFSAWDYLRFAPKLERLRASLTTMQSDFAALDKQSPDTLVPWKTYWHPRDWYTNWREK